MSLYHETAEILDTANRKGGSIKSIIFGRKSWKTDQKTLFALATEATKWSDVLSEVIEKSGILKIERQLTPLLSLLLSHDLLFARRGVALPSKHGLYVAISRHRARLSGELTKVRLRSGFATLESWKVYMNKALATNGSQTEIGSHPRWIRINTLRTTLNEQLDSTFVTYKRVVRLSDITTRSSDGNLLFVDEHVPDLIAIRSDVDITHSAAYKAGKLILQDKASCFPAYLLDPGLIEGDVIDTCAAPGNKTTHLAALMSSTNADVESHPRKVKIIACERDVARSETLTKMVKLAGATNTVRIKPKQDFLRLNPNSHEFSNVNAILLDPSCSGSGIVGRDEVTVKIHIPRVERAEDPRPLSKKRKRNENGPVAVHGAQSHVENSTNEETPMALQSDKSNLEARLTALSAFQLRLLEHAMVFPAATRITYSTCSTHSEENEQVVTKALISHVATERGWRIMRREEQVEGLRKWPLRGDLDSVKESLQDHGKSGTDVNVDLIASACIRCDKAGEDGTMGFFVAGFVRDSRDNSVPVKHEFGSDDDDGSDNEWNGFSDDD